MEMDVQVRLGGREGADCIIILPEVNALTEAGRVWPVGINLSM